MPPIKDDTPEELAAMTATAAAYGFEGDPGLVPIMHRTDEWGDALMVMSYETPSPGLMLIVNDRRLGPVPMATFLDAAGVDRLLDVLARWKARASAATTSPPGAESWLAHRNAEANDPDPSK